MSFQFNRLMERLVTESALKGPFLGVNRSHVIGKVGGGFENSVTEFARIASNATASAGRVVAKVAFVGEVPLTHSASVACISLKVNPLSYV